MTNNPPTHYALIIGINHYPNDRSLNGCVRDAHAVQEYLSLLQAPAPVECRILTATSPSPGGPSHPPEGPEIWPTHANVVSNLREIIRQVKTGDRVYFHFSGHGTITPATAVSNASPSTTPSTSSRSNRELSLVLYENDSIGSSYLRGRHLAGAFQKLVEKGVLVTVVLDCCFSGSVVRNGYAGNREDCDDDINLVLRRTGARFIDYSLVVDGSTAQNHDPTVVDWDQSHKSRASVLDRSQINWLLDPQGYTILTACGPYEIAHEIEVQGERRGALSYFLLASLHAFNKSIGGARESATGSVSHQALHENIRTRFHVSVPRQTPMRYGNTQLSFFGGLTAVTTANGAISLYRTASGNLCLDAGEAHGVCVGDQYAVSPPDTVGHSHLTARKANPVIVSVKTTRAFESDVEDIGRIRAVQSQGVGTGWSAKLVSSLSPFRIRVQLAAGITDRKLWIESAVGLRFVELSESNDEAQLCEYRIHVTNQTEYTVVDTLGMSIDGLPKIPCPSGAAATGAEGESAVGLTLSVLQHVATFKYFESLENKLSSSSFLGSFAITSETPGPHYQVRHGETWHLAIKNFGENPLYAAIFTFDETWEVCNIVSASGGDDYLVVPPKEVDGAAGRIVLPLGMEVPAALQEQGKTQCRDIIKVFVTSRPAAFPSMILPSVSISSDASRADTSQRAATRLTAFLDHLTASSRNTAHSDHGYGEWAARNFIIHTVMEKSG